MTVRKTKLALALGAAIGVASPAAHAVNIAEDGLGEVALMPYYTVRDGYDTYINVHNTSERTVIIKVRFREVFNSRDVRDFNVILSPKDVWGAAVTETSNGEGARINIYDNSCTVPSYIGAAHTGNPGGDGGIDFTNLLLNDGGPSGMDRTKEGYVEIINMGTIASEAHQIAVNSLHDSNGEPADCADNDSYFLDAQIAATRGAFIEPINVLKVTGALINTADGTGFSYDPVTLANFYNPAISGIDGAGAAGVNLVRTPGDTRPDLNSLSPVAADLHTDAPGISLNSTFATADVAWDNAGFARPAVDAVTALFMATNVYNQFRVEDGVADTDWVLTHPTKNYYVDAQTNTNIASLTSPDGLQPFPEQFVANASDPNASGACFTYGATHYDREEQYFDRPDTVPPSPPQPGADPDEMCREVNVLQLGTGVLGAHDPIGLGTGQGNYTSGWMDIDMLAGDASRFIRDTDGVQYNGLPVVGFAVQNLDNWQAVNENVQYGFLWDHAYQRDIDDSSNPNGQGFPAWEPGIISGS